mgnify:CR=1 FL=1
MLNRKRNDKIEDIDLEIEEWRAQNKKKVEIILFPGEKEYLVAKGLFIQPILYEIKDKQDLKCINSQINFIKLKYNEKTKKVFKLKHKEKKLLDNKGIKYETLGVILYL